MILVCAGCTTMKTYNQQAQIFANDLESANDPVKVVEAYKNDFYCPYQPKTFLLSYFGTEDQYKCLKRNVLLEQDIKFSCTIEGGYDYTNNRKRYEDNSDECVLYRRSPEFHESDVRYFDYKRFLGKDSIIKTDEDFLKLVEYYNQIAECDNLPETTSAEKETCKEKRKTQIRALATRRVPCSELINDRYTQFLQESYGWFQWDSEKDFKEKHKERLSSMKKSVKGFGEANFCTTDDWKQKLGTK